METIEEIIDAARGELEFESTAMASQFIFFASNASALVKG